MTGTSYGHVFPTLRRFESRIHDFRTSVRNSPLEHFANFANMTLNTVSNGYVSILEESNEERVVRDQVLASPTIL